MTDSNILSVFGLIVDIIGAIFIFKFGLPSDMYKRKLSAEEEKQHQAHLKQHNIGSYEDSMDAKDIAHRDKTKTMATVGLVLLIVGFSLQLLAQLPFATNNSPVNKTKCCCHKNN